MFPLAEQNAILYLETKPTITTTQCLTKANEVLRQYTDLLSYNFAQSYLTQSNNLVFDTSLVTRGTDYKPYFLALK